MNVPTPRLAAGLVLVLTALVLVACTGVARPSGWAPAQFRDDVVYVFEDNDRLSALELSNGVANTLWRFPDSNLPDEEHVDLEAVYGAPIHDPDRNQIYLAGFSGEVNAIDPDTGRLIWRQGAFRSEIVGDLALAGDRLFTATLGGRLYALHPTTGAFHPEWPPEGIEVGGEIWAAPVVIGDRVFVASMEGDVYAYNVEDGSPAWDEPFSKPGAIAELAVLDDSLLFVPGFNTYVDIVDPDTGQALTSFRANDWVWTRPFQDGDIIYFGDYSATLFALDITTGQPLWTFQAEEGRIKAAPVLVGNTVVFATDRAVVYFIDAASGTMRNRVPLQGASRVRANLSAHDGNAYIVGTSGALFRADPAALTVVEVPITRPGS